MMANIHKFETTIEVGGTDLDLLVEFELIPGEKRTFDYPGFPASVDIIEITNKEEKEEIPLEHFSKKQIQLIEEEALESLSSKIRDEANLADDKNREMEENKMSSDMTFASVTEAIQHLANKLGKKIVIGKEEEEEVYLKEAMIDDTHKLVLEDEKDGKYEVKIYKITDAGTNIDKKFSFSRLEQAEEKFKELLPKEEEIEKEETVEVVEEEGEGKMANDLIFTSSDEALQHLANLTGKKILVAGNKSTFPCPHCGTKVLENTKYCVKCKKKVEKK